MVSPLSLRGMLGEVRSTMRLRLGLQFFHLSVVDQLRSACHWHVIRVAGAFLFASLSALLTTEGAETVQGCLASWTSTVDDIWSYDVRLQVTHVTRSDTTKQLERVATYHLRHRYLQGMWRVDRLEDDPGEGVPISAWKAAPEDIHAIAWDGEQIRTFTSRSNFGQIQPLSTTNNSRTQGPLYHELFASTFWGQRYAEVIEGREGVTLSGHGSGGLLVLNVPPAPGQRATYARRHLAFTLDRDRDFVPTKIWVSTRSDSSKPMFEIENSLGELSSGRWLPLKSVKRIYRAKEGTEEVELFGEQQVEIDRSKAFVNVDIDPEIFRSRFPEGAIVYDETIHRNFVATADGGRDYDAYDRLAAEKAKAHRRSAGERRTANHGMLLIGIFVAVGVAAAAIVFVSRRIRKTTQR